MEVFNLFIYLINKFISFTNWWKYFLTSKGFAVSFIDSICNFETK